ncbi:MAG: hypothetical protein ACTSU4_08170 [Promethearchaeota archaeon]
MNGKEKELLKLKKLLKHWAEHNDSHVESFIKWRDIAKSHGLEFIAERLNRAIEQMKLCNNHLIAAHDALD